MLIESILPFIWAYWPAILAVTLSVHLLRNYFQKGLSKYPGPVLARFTNLWRFWITWNRRPDIHHLELHRKHGDVVRLGPNVLSFSSPAAMKTIYGLNKGMTKSGFYEVQQATVAGNRIPSLFSTLDEQYHQQLRRSVNHAFSMSALVQYEPSVNEILELFLDRTDELYASTKEVCPLSQWFQGYAFDVIGKITYSEDHGFIRNNEDIEGMIAKLHKIFDYAGPVGQIPFLDVLLIKNPILLLLDRWGFQWTAFPVAAFARRRLGERLYKADAPTDTSGRTDLLSMFLKAKADRPQFFTDRSVLTMSISMSFAGSDTTAISLSAVMYYLIRNRRCYDTVVEEIDAAVREGRIEDRQPSRIVSWTESRQLPYLDACIKEAFRCHPAAGLPLERVTPEQGIDIDGHYIPGGTIVGVNAWVLHKRPEVFDPEQRFPVSEYIPERWLEASKEQLKTMDGNMFQFGAGSRTCIGKNVSLLEIYKTIPSLLRRFEITFANPDPKDDWELWNAWFVRQKNFNVKFKARKYPEEKTTVTVNA